jgi:hypothetical protein
MCEGNNNTSSRIVEYETWCCQHYSRCGGYANIESNTQYITHDVITTIPDPDEMPLYSAYRNVST